MQRVPSNHINSARIACTAHSLLTTNQREIDRKKERKRDRKGERDREKERERERDGEGEREITGERKRSKYDCVWVFVYLSVCQ